MCRNIKKLFNFDPPATDEEVRAASLQFVRKLTGFTAPARANEAAFTRAVDDVATVAHPDRFDGDIRSRQGPLGLGRQGARTVGEPFRMRPDDHPPHQDGDPPVHPVGPRRWTTNSRRRY